MTPSMRTRTRLLIATIAAPALVAGFAACSSDTDTAGQTTTVTQTAPADSTGTDSTATGSTGTRPNASPVTGTSRSAPTSGSAIEVMLDGKAVQASFEPRRCKWERDEGHPQLEFDAGSDDSGGDLEVEIVLAQPPMLDDFALETADVKWKASKADRGAASITIDGDRYHVTSQVTDENDATRHADLEASFTCSRN